LSPAIEQSHVTLLSKTFGMGGVTQLGLLLHGSMSKFQSFLPSAWAIALRASSKYTIESYQQCTENSSKLQTHIIKYIDRISI
jgi:hypothetical protein